MVWDYLAWCVTSAGSYSSPEGSGWAPMNADSMALFQFSLSLMAFVKKEKKIIKKFASHMLIPDCH